MTHRARRSAGLIRLSSDNVTPLTQQLAETIRRLIVDGIWIKGDKLPGSRTIASDAHVSRNTVNASLEILMSEGMLESRGRSGVYVAWNHPSRSARTGAAKPLDIVVETPFSLEAMPRDLFPVDSWKRLQTRHLNKTSSASLEATAAAGLRELRETIATYANVALGIACSVEQIIVVGGLRDALSLLRFQLQEREPSIWSEEPGHLATRFAIRAAGLAAEPVLVDAQGLNVEAAQQTAPNARLAIVRPAFQFPTGAMLSAARAKELVEWSKRNEALIVEDARDSEFLLVKRAPRPLAMLSPKAVVHFNSFSRTVFPSIGVGYLIVPPALAESFQRSCRQVEMNVPLATQRALADFISSGLFAKHLRKCNDVIDERREALFEAVGDRLATYLKFDRQLGGLHMCARLIGRESDAAIAVHARAAGVDVAPLSATFAAEPREQGLLLGFAGFDAPTIVQAVRSLALVFSGHAASPAQA